MYSTRDLKFAAVLHTLGYEYDFSTQGTRVVFHFEALSDSVVKDVRIKYNNKSEDLLVKPLVFIEAWNSMLDIVMDVKRASARGIKGEFQIDKLKPSEGASVVRKIQRTEEENG